jgi:hypothetical protein
LQQLTTPFCVGCHCILMLDPSLLSLCNPPLQVLPPRCRFHGPSPA